MNNQPIAEALQAAVQAGGQEVPEFFVKTLTGKSLVIRHTPGLTIRQVKEDIFKMEHIPIDQQRLVFHGKNLEDDHTVADYAVQAGNTLHLVLRLRGGI